MGMSHVIPELINKIILKNKKNVNIYSPSHKRVFCYIDDCINQIISTCFKKQYLQEVLNIGSNQKEIKIYKLAKLINELSSNKKKLIYSTITPGSPRRRVPDVQKILKNIRNYKETQLLDGIKNTIRWYIK
jgi:nucleoside-diphosphate-sugar epimerase